MVEEESVARTISAVLSLPVISLCELAFLEIIEDFTLIYVLTGFIFHVVVPVFYRH